MTRATGSGTGAEIITVGDTSYFTDGMGIIEGDTIRIGRDAEAKSVRILDATHLKLDRWVTWQAGAAVSLPYVGEASDLGALEHRAK